MYICVYIYIYIYSYNYVYTYIYIFIYIKYIYIYVYLNVHVEVQTQRALAPSAPPRPNILRFKPWCSTNVSLCLQDSVIHPHIYSTSTCKTLQVLLVILCVYVLTTYSRRTYYRHITEYT